MNVGARYIMRSWNAVKASHAQSQAFSTESKIQRTKARSGPAMTIPTTAPLIWSMMNVFGVVLLNPNFSSMTKVS